MATTTSWESTASCFVNTASLYGKIRDAEDEQNEAVDHNNNEKKAAEKKQHTGRNPHMAFLFAARQTPNTTQLVGEETSGENALPESGQDADGSSMNQQQLHQSGAATHGQQPSTVLFGTQNNPLTPEEGANGSSMNQQQNQNSDQPEASMNRQQPVSTHLSTPNTGLRNSGRPVHQQPGTPLARQEPGLGAGMQPGTSEQQLEGSGAPLHAEGAGAAATAQAKPTDFGDIMRMIAMIFQICMQIRASECESLINKAKEIFKKNIEAASAHFNAGQKEHIVGAVFGFLSVGLSTGALGYGAAKGAKGLRGGTESLRLGGSGGQLPGGDQISNDTMTRFLSELGGKLSQTASNSSSIAADADREQAALCEADARLLESLKDVLSRYLSDVAELSRTQLSQLQEMFAQYSQHNNWVAR